MDQNDNGVIFLNKLYKNLHMSEEVNSAIKQEKKLKPTEKITVYMDKLEETHTKFRDNENALRRLKELYYDKYVIKSQDVPESYFKLQEKIALDRGYGHITYTESQKQQEIQTIITEQEKSLDNWLDYFMSEDADVYPMWAKYWAFQGMLSLGVFDKEQQRFNKRAKGTTAIFVELNQEALALSIDMLIESNKGNEINDEELKKLLDNGSFGKIYAYILEGLLKNNKTNAANNQGEWVKYKKGTDHMPLVASLQGKGTGWCTAGQETAKSQLANGDFYVYYSYDENNQPTIPRIAIRMNDNSIAEVRGIAKNQNLEPEMTEILDKKLEDFPDKDKYNKKVKDMEVLTTIYKKYQENTDLDINDLRFLYEVDSKIQGFGYQKDPRIEAIIYKRYKRQDLSAIFNCELEQISLNDEEARKDNIIYHHGELNMNHITNFSGGVLPKIVGGNVSITKITVANRLILPKKIIGSLNLELLTNADGLILPETIEWDLFLYNLTSAKDTIFPKIVGRSLDLQNLINGEGIILPETIGMDLNLYNLNSAKGLVFPKTIGRSLFLDGLTNCEGLILPETIGQSLYLNSLTNIDGLILPKMLNGTLDFRSLINGEGLILPETIGENLKLSNLINAKNMVFPKTVGKDLDLNNLIDGEGLKLPETIGGTLGLYSLTNAKGLVLPKTIERSLYLDSLTNGEGLILPKTIGENLYLNNLTNAKGLVFPEKIGGDLYLKGLTNGEGLILPETIGGTLGLYNLTSAKGLVLPKKVGSLSISRQVINQLDDLMPEEFDSIAIFDNDDDAKNSASAIVIPKELYQDVQKTTIPGFDRHKGTSVILYEKGKKLSECEIILTHVEQLKEEQNRTF
jgi:phage protein U